jgi:hypothetical protein
MLSPAGAPDVSSDHPRSQESLSLSCVAVLENIHEIACCNLAAHRNKTAGGEVSV